MQETQIYSVVKIELTPNPRSMKFILDHTVLDTGSKTISEGGFLEVDSFAHNMFALDIVDMVYLRENFVSVTLTSADLWVVFKDKIKNIIEADLEKYTEGDNEVSASILDDFDMGTGDFTFECWVKAAESSGEYAGIFGMYDYDQYMSQGYGQGYDGIGLGGAPFFQIISLWLAFIILSTIIVNILIAVISDGFEIYKDNTRFRTKRRETIIEYIFHRLRYHLFYQWIGCFTKHTILIKIFKIITLLELVKLIVVEMFITSPE